MCSRKKHAVPSHALQLTLPRTPSSPVLDSIGHCTPHNTHSRDFVSTSFHQGYMSGSSPVVRNLGGRFSMKLFTPSSESGWLKLHCSNRLSSRCACSGLELSSCFHSMAFVSVTDDGEQFSTISRAISRAFGMTSSSGTKWLKSPVPSASIAGNTRPVMHHSSASATPTSFGRKYPHAASGTIPRRAKTKPSLALSETIRISAASVGDKPPPTAVPLIAAMTGFRQRLIVSDYSPPLSRCVAARDGFAGSPSRAARLLALSPANAALPSSGAKSAPAQKIV